MSSNRRLDNYNLPAKKLEEYSAEHLQPQPLVTGADLIGMGYAPGPQFSQILRRWKTRNSKASLSSQAEAMDMVREHFPQMN